MNVGIGVFCNDSHGWVTDLGEGGIHQQDVDLPRVRGCRKKHLEHEVEGSWTGHG